ncbi:MAG: hypothetical protein P8I55_14930 [Crocinitomix sp.]|nr:hypothetical protein [Crocinitomix sp.]
MTSDLQDILVYSFFAAAIGYFAFRFYRKNLKKKPVGGALDKSCSSGNCGCD